MTDPAADAAPRMLPPPPRFADPNSSSSDQCGTNTPIIKRPFDLNFQDRHYAMVTGLNPSSGGLRAAVVAAAADAVVHVAPGQRDRAIAEAAKEVGESSCISIGWSTGIHPSGQISGGDDVMMIECMCTHFPYDSMEVMTLIPLRAVSLPEGCLPAD